jgi:hypothetical protein
LSDGLQQSQRVQTLQLEWFGWWRLGVAPRISRTTSKNGESKISFLLDSSATNEN